ncbi:hypothetical protein GCL60_16585 [Silvanigrella paludirubra]|uniref:Uncharacterized protein n=1 Tax=Silvanigrella paludirubra TaxID=2499159 RepID=A0A6N6VNA8_9BACT|nr:hypothetical protein [Silvanigrella paludirubra]KAB8035846.1 hypothetical protein GCL60_16585 [Silvanigrella paludirubra]
MQFERNISIIVTPSIGGEGLIFENFRINFEVQKSIEKKVQNTAKIQIYNLGDNSFNFIKQNNMAVTIKVSRKEQAYKLLFFGKINRASKEKKDTDWIIKIESGDSGNAYNSAKLSKSYPEKTTHNNVFDDLKNELLKGNIIKGVKGVFASDNLFNNGFAAHGNVGNIMDNILTANNYEWQINNGILEIQKKGNSYQVIKLSSESGLVDSPEVTENGIKVTCLLQPEIAPLRQVYVESLYIKSVYIPSKVTHTGDNLEGKFLTTFETGEKKKK